MPTALLINIVLFQTFILLNLAIALGVDIVFFNRGRK